MDKQWHNLSNERREELASAAKELQDWQRGTLRPIDRRPQIERIKNFTYYIEKLVRSPFGVFIPFWMEEENVGSDCIELTIYRFGRRQREAWEWLDEDGANHYFDLALKGASHAELYDRIKFSARKLPL